MTYKKWLNIWLENYIKPSSKERTYIRYWQLIRTHIAPKIGDKDVNDLTPIVLQSFVTKLLSSGNDKTGKGLSANTVNAVISVMQNSLRTAHLLGYAKEYTANMIKRPKAKEKQVNCFTVSEQKKIENYIQSSKDKKLFGILLCLYTGLRIGELLALKWSDFDLHKGIFTVSKTCKDTWENGWYVKISLPPKTEMSNRNIPIPKQLLPKIKALKKAAKTEYFVCGRSEYGSQVRSYQKTFDRLLQKIKIPHRGFHSLRHTFATRALECGMDIKTLSEILGHKNPTVTLNRYAHSMFEHKANMMNRLGKLLVNSNEKST